MRGIFKIHRLFYKKERSSPTLEEAPNDLEGHNPLTESLLTTRSRKYEEERVIYEKYIKFDLLKEW